MVSTQRRRSTVNNFRFRLLEYPEYKRAAFEHIDRPTAAARSGGALRRMEFAGAAVFAAGQAQCHAARRPRRARAAAACERDGADRRGARPVAERRADAAAQRAAL